MDQREGFTECVDWHGKGTWKPCRFLEVDLKWFEAIVFCFADKSLCSPLLQPSLFWLNANMSRSRLQILGIKIMISSPFVGFASMPIYPYSNSLRNQRQFELESKGVKLWFNKTKHKVNFGIDSTLKALHYPPPFPDSFRCIHFSVTTQKIWSYIEIIKLFCPPTPARWGLRLRPRNLPAVALVPSDA